MKRLTLGLVVILFSIQTIGCDSGGGGTAGAGARAPPCAPAADAPAAKNAPPSEGRQPRLLLNPNGPKNDR